MTGCVKDLQGGLGRGDREKKLKSSCLWFKNGMKNVSKQKRKKMLV